jgi:DNA-binding FadR family transcriptional regulator
MTVKGFSANLLMAKQTLDPPDSYAAPIFKTLRRDPAYKAVSGVMEQHILSGRLKTGTALPTELDLAAQFGVNRSTIREAIRQLEQEGLVERRGGKKMFVALPGLFDLAPRAARALIMNQVTFQELWEVAIVVEPAAARLAAQRIDEADFAQLDANLAACRATLDTADLAMAAQIHSGLDVEFHALVARASRNRSLMLAREPFSLLYRPALTLLQKALPQSALRNVQAHEQILNALKARDPDRSYSWMHKHLVDFRAGFLKAGLPMDAPVEALTDPMPAAVNAITENFS